MGSTGTSPMYSLQTIPGKGKGLIAEQTISAGTLLISEAPLFTTESLSNPSTIEKDLGRIIRALPKESQRAFLSLQNNNPGSDPFSNIVRSNGYPLGPSSDIGGIFPIVARINHSCLPNAQHAWNDKLKVMLVHAVREIPKGDELTLSYVTGGPSHERQSNLNTYFGFDCACELCSLPADKLAISDERLQRAQKLDEAIGDPKRVRKIPEKALADCRALLDIYEQEQIRDLRLPRLYHDAFQICAMHSDEARASVFARLSCEARILCEGEQSTAVAEEKVLATEPRRYENFGVTTLWKTSITAVPKRASNIASDRWLWRESA